MNDPGKRDLSKGKVLVEAVAQLGQYVKARVDQTGTQYLGVLTDGREWRLFVHDSDAPDGVIQAGEPLIITSDKDEAILRDWLGAVLATQQNIRPTPHELRRQFGANSPAHSAYFASLRALYEAGQGNAEIKLKRELWSKLLRTAFGESFEDDPDLFIDHTLLVITAEIIAHAVLGFDVSRKGPLSPEDLASGAEFQKAEILGVVEADFFDWPLQLAEGAEIVRSLADRVAKFDWSAVEHDVLKHLYESTIAQEVRESLGEYYTPDWLAERMVADSVREPSTMRVLDPSCGSGTFVFHAARRCLEALSANGVSDAEAVERVTSLVYGMDIHPVAVTLARVTYLLAIGTNRLRAPGRKPISIPVFLGDSLQWEQASDLFHAADMVTVGTKGDALMSGGGGTLLDDDLVFPRSVVGNAHRFDALVSAMADKALDVSGTQDRTLIAPILKRFAIEDDAEKRVITSTFSTMRALHRTGRNHIWGYYVRNLVRPLWLTEKSNKVDVLIGNPPWLRYSKMPGPMQDRYKALCRERNLLTGSLGASARDLSTLFVVRAVELYGTDVCRFSFVMPHGTLTRKPHHGFRSGAWTSNTAGGSPLYAAFDEAWDLAGAARVTGFPMVACVLRGAAAKTAKKVPAGVQAWKIKGSNADQSWAAIEPKVTITNSSLLAQSHEANLPTSPYKKTFRAGAIIYPRALFFVNELPLGPLGAAGGRVPVSAQRSNLEKKPWKFVETLKGSVEAEFIHSVHLGETVRPFLLGSPLRAVVPISQRKVSEMASQDEVDEYAGLSDWWADVERVWKENRKPSEKSPLRERVDYSRQLTAQLPPSAHPQRVVYTASGNTLAAARLEDTHALIEHKLYWAPVKSVDEGRYLVGIINSNALLERIRPLQNLGLFGPRDFDKLVFDVAFDAFDASNPAHAALVEIVESVEEHVASLQLPEGQHFRVLREKIRASLASADLLAPLEEAAAAVLPDPVELE